MTTELATTDAKPMSLREMMQDILLPILGGGVELLDGVRVFTYLGERMTARALAENLRLNYPQLRKFMYISVLTEINRAARRSFGATRVQPPRGPVAKGTVRDLARAELKKRIAAMTTAELAKLAK